MRKIVIAISSNSIAMREATIGIYEYVNAGHDWELRILQLSTDLTPSLVRKLRKEGCDGIITGIEDFSPRCRALLDSNIPLALVNVPPGFDLGQRPNISLVRMDEIAVGRLGARFLATRAKFNSYGFVPTDTKTYWSTVRQRGFRNELAARGIGVRTFRWQRRIPLADFILNLPKPAAILAANDNTATRVIAACHAAGLRIPEQVAVLGVDNDELYCTAVHPTLSSIHPNQTEVGRLAAAELDRMMSGKATDGRTLFAKPLEVIERDSTKRVPPAAELIRRAHLFIQKKAADGISAKDVARHLGVSASLLRLRYRTVQGHSVESEIMETRLLKARKLLTDANRAGLRRPGLVQIARQCGFASACRLSHAYKTFFGQAPSCGQESTSANTAFLLPLRLSATKPPPLR